MNVLIRTTSCCFVMLLATSAVRLAAQDASEKSATDAESKKSAAEDPSEKSAENQSTSVDEEGSSAKLPIPNLAEQKEKRKFIQGIYKEEASKARKSSPSEYREFARKLLQVGTSTREDVTGRYVLYQLAIEVASQIGDIDTVFEAIEQMAKEFQIDALTMKSQAVEKALKARLSIEKRKTLLMRALKLIDQLVAADQFADALKLSTSLLAAARKYRDAALMKRLMLHKKEIVEMGKVYTKAKKELAKLDQSPTDPAANLAVGKYRCFYKDDWAGGLMNLALGSDPKLKTLAKMELQNPTDAKQQVALGNGWWELIELEKGTPQRRIKLRAAKWYSQALPGLTGLSKRQLEKRLKELQKEFALVAEGNVALASRGATVAGAKSSSNLLDGVTTGYTSSKGFASGSWPCKWVITLPEAYLLSEIRFLLWDGDSRYYRYVVEVSEDGENFVVVTDRSKGEWKSWQRIPFAPRPVKFILVTGLYNSKNSGFFIVELEAYCNPPAVVPASRKSGSSRKSESRSRPSRSRERG